jgi:hypothetical protein
MRRSKGRIEAILQGLVAGSRRVLNPVNRAEVVSHGSPAGNTRIWRALSFASCASRLLLFRAVVVSCLEVD